MSAARLRDRCVAMKTAEACFVGSSSRYVSVQLITVFSVIGARLILSSFLSRATREKNLAGNRVETSVARKYNYVNEECNNVSEYFGRGERNFFRC